MVYQLHQTTITHYFEALNTLNIFLHHDKIITLYSSKLWEGNFELGYMQRMEHTALPNLAKLMVC